MSAAPQPVAIGPRICGIDPGINGGLAFYWAGCGAIAAEDLPVADKMLAPAVLAERLRSFGPQIVVIEQVGAMPGNGASSMFRFGQAFGAIIGVTAGLGLSYRLVTPSKWKKAMGLNADGEVSRAAALQRWPDRAELFARKKDHNRAEAALLAVYGARVLSEEGK